MAQAALGDLYAKVEAIIDEHPIVEWRERAKGQSAAFVSAALIGTKPARVAFKCTKCTASGHSHHFLCRTNQRPKERDEKVKAKVIRELDKAAAAFVAAQVRCVRHPLPP